jgi:hypothetical protein
LSPRQAYFNLGEYLSLVDLSLTVKMGVQYSFVLNSAAARSCAPTSLAPLVLVRQSLGRLNSELGDREASKEVFHGD